MPGPVRANTSWGEGAPAAVSPIKKGKKKREWEERGSKKGGGSLRKNQRKRFRQAKNKAKHGGGKACSSEGNPPSNPNPGSGEDTDDGAANPGSTVPNPPSTPLNN